MPRLAAEGSDVLLLAHNVSKNPLGYAWHRGERVNSPQLIASYRVDTNATTNGAVYSGRETLYPNGTLLIRNVTQRDTGPYTLLVKKNDLWIETQTGHLHVHHEYFLSDHGMFCRRGRGGVLRLNSVHTGLTAPEGASILLCIMSRVGV